jgi:hypothetical protein
MTTSGNRHNGALVAHSDLRIFITVEHFAPGPDIHDNVGSLTLSSPTLRAINEGVTPQYVGDVRRAGSIRQRASSANCEWNRARPRQRGPTEAGRRQLSEAGTRAGKTQRCALAFCTTSRTSGGTMLLLRTAPLARTSRTSLAIPLLPTGASLEVQAISALPDRQRLPSEDPRRAGWRRALARWRPSAGPRALRRRALIRLSAGLG